MSTLKAQCEQVNEYTHYADENYEFRTPLQSILLKAKKEDLWDILCVYLVYTNAKVDYHVVGNPPLHMAIVVSFPTLILNALPYTSCI